MRKRFHRQLARKVKAGIITKEGAKPLFRKSKIQKKEEEEENEPAVQGATMSEEEENEPAVQGRSSSSAQGATNRPGGIACHFQGRKQRLRRIYESVQLRGCSGASWIPKALPTNTVADVQKKFDDGHF